MKKPIYALLIVAVLGCICALAFFKEYGVKEYSIPALIMAAVCAAAALVLAVVDYKRNAAK